MNDEVKQLITAVGAMAEMLSEFTKQLQKNGYSRAEAVALTHTYLKTIVIQNKEDN